MPQYQLRDLGTNNAGVSLPLHALERDGLLDNGTVPDEQLMDVERLGPGVFLVRAADEGELPDLRETDVVQDAVARELMERNAFDGVQPSAD